MTTSRGRDDTSRIVFVAVAVAEESLPPSMSSHAPKCCYANSIRRAIDVNVPHRIRISRIKDAPAASHTPPP
jgi:hypothetical protein